MAYALVGSLGAVSTGTSGAAVTPAYGQSPTLGNLLILWVASNGSATLPAAITGWTLTKDQAGTTCSTAVYYKIAAGADAQPTVALITSSVLSAQLGEFSGNVRSSAGVRLGANGAAATTSPISLTTLTSADRVVGNLTILASNEFYSTTTTPTLTLASTFVTSMNQTDNAGTSTADHYAFGWGINTSLAGGNFSGRITFTTTSITGASLTGVTFTAPSGDMLTAI